jgi:hypothetical protein
MLTSDLEAALRQLAFHPPRTPDCTVTDAYATTTAEAVLCHLQAVGWRLERGPGDWWMDFDLTEHLRQTLRYPLLMARKPPLRRYDPARYWRQVAEAVAARLLEAGWSEADDRVLLKRPPARPHSTPWLKMRTRDMHAHVPALRYYGGLERLGLPRPKKSVNSP